MPGLHYLSSTVDDWAIELLPLSHVGVHMQWVDVSTEAVEEGLARVGFSLEDMVGLSLGDFGKLGEEALAFEAESSESLEEEGVFVVECKLFLALVVEDVGVDPEHDEGIFALVCHIHDFGLVGVLDARLEVILHHHHLLLCVQDHEGTELGHAVAVQQLRDDVASVGHHSVGGEGHELFIQLVSVFVILLPQRI